MARTLGYTGMPLHGVLSVTCPGAVDTWVRLHANHGSLDWDKLSQPAIKAATVRFSVSTSRAL